MGMLEYWEIHAFGGPRFVVAGRDRARPSRLLAIFSHIIPIFHHSIIPCVNPSFIQAN